MNHLQLRPGAARLVVKVLILSLSLGACVTTGGGTRTAAADSPAAATPAVPACKPLPTMSDSKRMAVSAAAGAVVGGVIGASSGKRRARNAAGGALAGALVGALASSAFKNEIDVEEQDDGSVRLKIPGSVMFASGRSDLSASFQSTLTSVAQTVRQYCSLSVHVVGHTDSVGAVAANQKLSQDRAQSVLMLFRSQGLGALTAEGRGAQQPIASNADEAGRQANRRVEVFVRPPANH
jgi:outer membrane protein OmpA-like peptidoglycan-associated protein